jgi:hypothetical protein
MITIFYFHADIIFNKINKFKKKKINKNRYLLESKKWKINSVDCYVLFPGSDHIESVVVFDKISNS